MKKLKQDQWVEVSITEKTGKLVSIKTVTDNDDLMIINKSGIAIRMAVQDLRVMGRATQGVKLINLKNGDSIAAVAKVIHDDVVAEDETDEVEPIENNDELPNGTTLDNNPDENN